MTEPTNWLTIVGAVALLVAPVLGFAGTLLGSYVSRKSQREANDTQRFATFTAALETRLGKTESELADALRRIDSLEAAKDALEAEKRERDAINQAQSRYIRKLLRIIASHLPELEQSLLLPEPEDVRYITLEEGVFPRDAEEEE